MTVTSSGRSLPAEADDRPRSIGDKVAGAVGFVGLLALYIATSVVRNFEGGDQPWRSPGMTSAIAVTVALAGILLVARNLLAEPTTPDDPPGERALAPIRSLNAGFALFERYAVAICLLLMVGLYAVNVLLRNIGNLPDGVVDWLEDSPFPTQSPAWIEPIVRHLVLIVGMLGASLAASERRHIRIEFASKFLPPGARRIVDALVMAIAAIGSGILVWASLYYFQLNDDQFLSGLGPLYDSTVHVRVTAVLGVIPVALGTAAFRFGLHAAESAFAAEAYDEDAALAADMAAADENTDAPPGDGAAAPSATGEQATSTGEAGS